MREPSKLFTRNNENVTRCTCGAWKYEGNQCAVCATLRGVENGLSTYGTTAAPDDLLP
jgi:hypothetical protein